MQIFKKLYSRWKALAHKIGVFQSKVILTLFYFILLLPFGIIFSFFKDELCIKNKQKTAWRKKENRSESIEDLRRQF